MALKNIVLYTTRPIRDNEIDGEEYHFVDESKLRELENAGKVIECRCYDTVFGPWYYFTAADDQVDLDKKDYMAIGTVDSFVSFKDFYGEDKVVPIYIEVEDGIRLSRALNREMSQDKPKYEEMCRRFLADAKDFSEENFVAVSLDIAAHLFEIMKENIDIPAADLMLVHYRYNEKQYLVGRGNLSPIHSSVKEKSDEKEAFGPDPGPGHGGRAAAHRGDGGGELHHH